MLGFHIPAQMPHATEPSTTSRVYWPQSSGAADSLGPRYSAYNYPLDTPALSPKIPITISPTNTMSGGTVAYREPMNPNFVSGPNLASLPSHSSSYKSAYVGSTDPSHYSTNSVHSSSLTHHSKTPDSQRSYVTQSESSSPRKVTSTLSIPDTVRVPQHDLSQLAAEVRNKISRTN
jgi:hypothetical protein